MPEEIYEGLNIEYKINLPILGKTKWVTEILEVNEGISFIDLQKRGPYKLWHHKHELIKIEDNITEIIDIVDYEMPMSFLGEIAHYLALKKQLKEIFDSRYESLRSVFK